MFGTYGQGAKILNCHAKSLRLQVKKRSGSSSADFIQSVVLDIGVAALRVPAQKDQLGVLSADFDNGAGAGVEMTGGLGLRHYLIDILYFEYTAQQLSTTSCCDNPMKPIEVIAEFIESVPQNDQRTALCTSI